MRIFQFKEGEPLFKQITSKVANEIVNGHLKEGDQVPSTNDFAKMLQINPATAAKGINLLVDQGILFKKRGIGMFVQTGARDILLAERKSLFYDSFIVPLVHEMDYLNLDREEVEHMIDKERGKEK